MAHIELAANPQAVEEVSPWMATVQLVEERLLASAIALQPRTEDFLDLLLPRGVEEDTAQHLLAISRFSAAVPDEALIRHMGLVDLTAEPADRQRPFEERISYYIRSLRLPVDDFYRLLEQYQQDYPADTLFIEQFLDQQRLSGETTHVFVRYAGCTSDNTPLGRLQEDIMPNATPSRFTNFYRCLLRIFPLRATQFRVFLVPRFSMQGQLGDVDLRYQADGREQFLIHFLGRAVLLNSQPGGYFRAYEPQPDDMDALREYDENPLAYRYLFNEANDAADDDQDVPELVQVNREIVRNIYRLNYQQEPVAQTILGRITDGHIDMYKDQAISRTAYVETRTGGEVLNCAPLMIFAKDITLSDFSGLKPYFAGSRSGELTKELIGHCFPDRVTNNFVEPPFHDLWPCPPGTTRRDQVPPVLVQTSAQVIGILRSVVVVTLGWDSAATAYSYFKDGYSLGHDEYQDQVGVAQVIDYDYQFVPTLERPIPEDPKYAILMPHLDPGFVSYGAADPTILQFMHLTWCKTILLVEEVLRTLERSDPAVSPPGTHAFCEEILFRYRERLDQGELEARFQRAKAAAIALTRTTMRERVRGALLRAEMNGTPVAEAAYRPGQYAADVMRRKHERYDVTRGAPNSVTRMQQRLFLERARYPELRRLRSFHERTWNNAWDVWFDGLPTGRRILGSLLERIAAERVEPIPGLSPSVTRIVRTRVPRPEGFTDDQWMSIPEVVSAAFSEYMRDLRSRIRPAPAEVLRARSRLGNQSRLRRRAIDIFRLQTVNCDAGGRIHFTVLVDPAQELFRAERDGIYVGRGYVGPKILDLDEDVCPYALVLKSQNAEGEIVFPVPLTPAEQEAARAAQEAALANADELDVIVGRPVNAVLRLDDQQQARPEPQEPDEDPQDGRVYIEDWYLLFQSREIYFPCFVRTLEACGLPLRDFVREEWINPQFDWQNVMDGFLRTFCPVVNHEYEFTSEDTGRGQALNFWTCVEDVVRQSQNQYERKVWLRNIRNENRGKLLTRIQNTITSIQITKSRRTSTIHPQTRIMVHYSRYHITHIPGRAPGNQPEPDQPPVRRRRRIN